MFQCPFWAYCYKFKNDASQSDGQSEEGRNVVFRVHHVTQASGQCVYFIRAVDGPNCPLEAAQLD